MNKNMYYDKILKITEKNNGYITTKEVVNAGIDKKFLTNMVKNGKLIRISKGYYGLPNYITLPYGYSGTLQKQKNVILNFVSRDILDLGVIEMESPFGMKIKVYDIERTICDIIKNKNKIDGEIFSKALKDYAKSKSKNLNKLASYAKIMKIEKKVGEYMEVLL